MKCFRSNCSGLQFIFSLNFLINTEILRSTWPQSPIIWTCSKFHNSQSKINESHLSSKTNQWMDRTRWGTYPNLKNIEYVLRNHLILQSMLDVDHTTDRQTSESNKKNRPTEFQAYATHIQAVERATIINCGLPIIKTRHSKPVLFPIRNNSVLPRPKLSSIFIHKCNWFEFSLLINLLAQVPEFENS